MPASLRVVTAEDKGGCGIAALAMLTGHTYQQVAADFKQPLENGNIYDLIHHVPSMVDIDRYLAERGFAVCRLYLRDLFGPRIVWPPEPFAEMHLCVVKPKQFNPDVHWTVMLGDGTILDGSFPEIKRLSDYYLVLNVAAVVKLPTAGATVFRK